MSIDVCDLGRDHNAFLLTTVSGLSEIHPLRTQGRRLSRWQFPEPSVILLNGRY
ncbi:hypothetical protein [Sphingomonas turrisvirgatae]|uniref:hypothetical protein n=1 Tax=Sphingomonas turrisvirgatae TaxID=1888892 RepID=UPI0013013E63|nr:hypothetical protein [Sphingomonas turrisvirgatae]